MAKRPYFEKNRGKPESSFGHMRQSNYLGSFQSVWTGLRRVSQIDGWSRGYEDGTQRVPIDRTHTDKIFS